MADGLRTDDVLGDCGFSDETRCLKLAWLGIGTINTTIVANGAWPGTTAVIERCLSRPPFTRAFQTACNTAAPITTTNTVSSKLCSPDNGRLDDIPRVECILVVRQAVVVPTQKEGVRVIAALPARLRPLLWLIAETGCRKGEAFNLT